MMVEHPLNVDDCYVELLKLQKLFESSFRITEKDNEENSCNLGEVTELKDAYKRGSITINLLLRPTDPEFDTASLLPLDGLKLKIRLYRTESNHFISESGCNSTKNDPIESTRNGSIGKEYYHVLDPCDIAVENENLPDRTKNVIKKLLFEFIAKNKGVYKHIIHEALKFLGKSLSKVITVASSKSNSVSDNPWTLEEQKSLEIALTRAQAISDPSEKWLFISRVLKTRTPEECRRRFFCCRESIKNKQREEQRILSSFPVDYEPLVGHSASLRLLGLEISKISLLTIKNFLLQLSCFRCNFNFDCLFLVEGKGSTLIRRNCEKCNVAHLCEFTVSVAFSTRSTIGKLSLENCAFMDFLNGEFYITCESCGVNCKVRDVRTGTKKVTNCRGCFVRCSLSFEGVEFADEVRTEPKCAKSKATEINKNKSKKCPPSKGLKVGTPLPDSGTCKHYKRSFRWFRFPCCGKAFPCDSCHDEKSDHKCEHANLIICGYCSTQQSASSKKCKFCERSYKATSSSYWEGGKGCRDATKIRKNDSKKYKLMRRQMEKTKSSK